MVINSQTAEFKSPVSAVTIWLIVFQCPGTRSSVWGAGKLPGQREVLWILLVSLQEIGETGKREFEHLDVRGQFPHFCSSAKFTWTDWQRVSVECGVGLAQIFSDVCPISLIGYCFVVSVDLKWRRASSANKGPCQFAVVTVKRDSMLRPFFWARHPHQFFLPWWSAFISRINAHITVEWNVVSSYCRRRTATSKSFQRLNLSLPWSRRLLTRLQKNRPWVTSEWIGARYVHFTLFHLFYHNLISFPFAVFLATFHGVSNQHSKASWRFSDFQS